MRGACACSCLARVDVNTDVCGCKPERLRSISACRRENCVCVCVKCMCFCGEQGSGPCRPRPPSVNWKRRLLSQRHGSNQRPVSETKGTLLK